MIILHIIIRVQVNNLAPRAVSKEGHQAARQHHRRERPPGIAPASPPPPADRHHHRTPRPQEGHLAQERPLDRKSTRLNSSHLGISYAVFCLKKKKRYLIPTPNNITTNFSLSSTTTTYPS